MLLRILSPLLLASSLLAADPLPRAEPEAKGVSSPQLTKFVRTLDESIVTPHSVMVVRGGAVVAEGWWKPEAADKPHVMWSVSKSFTSMAVGLAAADGKLSLDDPVLKFFPEDAPDAPSENLRAMTVRHLLTMTCGHDAEPQFKREGGWARRFLTHPVPHEPGTHFLYNSMGSFMLSAIVQKVTGETVRDYLAPRLFEPLGIEIPRWDANPDGVSLGGWGLFLKTEDMAKFGQLLLQEGEWDGRQLLPRDYLGAATRKQADNNRGLMALSPDWSSGYGYQFWMTRNGGYRADGLAGQYIIVLPQKDAVVAITCRTPQMPAVLSIVWDELLPALKDTPLPADPNAAADLRDALSGLEVTTLPPRE